MAKVYNFSAGPAVLPHEVLATAQAEMLDWHGSGMCVMEMSHRGKEFMEIIHDAEQDLRALMAIPAGYKVLFLQGGASQQFSMVPLNLAPVDGHIDVLDTGHWSKLAVKEARRYTNVNVVASSADSNYAVVPDVASWQRTPDAAYFHYTSNETIGGLQCPFVPDVGDTPLVCDMSSDFLSREVDVSKFGLIYAGAQKNIGPSGLTLVIIHRDLLGMAPLNIPTVLDYAVMAENGSMLNTPPTFGIYMAGLVFQWLKRQGGLSAIDAVNSEKAQILYAAIDGSAGFYTNPVDPDCRSRMNVPFVLRDAALDADFLAEAKAAGLLALKGHKSVGGMRASIYNAVPLAAVQALVDFMNDFARRKG